MARNRKSPSDTAAKWLERTKGAGAEMRKGVERVTEAPGVLAAAKAGKMRERLVAKIDDGTWAERVASVSLPEWKDKMLKKGVGRVAAGADAAVPKVVEFHGQLSDHQTSIDSELESMPDVTLADGLARSAHQITRMAQFKRRS